MRVTLKEGDSPSLDVISKGDHAHGLPDTETDPRGDTPVKSLDTALLPDVTEGAADGQRASEHGYRREGGGR